MTQLVPTGVSLQMCLGFVGFVQPKLASSYTPLALQGQPGGASLCLIGGPLALAHPMELPTGLLDHPAKPELAVQGLMSLGQGVPVVTALPLAPSL